MSLLRAANFVEAVPSTADPDAIADAVTRWQARYQPLSQQKTAAPPPAPVSVAAPSPELKEAAVNWFAEARRQDQADQAEIKDRINRLLGRGVMG
jgi:hypothetical protein